MPPWKFSAGVLVLVALGTQWLPKADCGIHGLAPLLAKEAPEAAHERTLHSFQGKKVAIDASMTMYQFLIAVRASGDNGVAATLSTVGGEDTSHLQGFFWRTIAMIKAGIKPLYVFDGKPPVLKSGELAHRNSRRAEGERKLQEAAEAGDVEGMNKFSKRTTRVTRKHAEDCKTLLKLMGVPTLDAPSEAEAQCAALTKAGIVYATATEDMDALCCGAPILVRRLTVSEARGTPPVEYNLTKVLSALHLNMTQFVDFCILCGCDFTESIKGIGPKTALNGIRKHGSIEALVETLNKTRYAVPEDFPIREVRQLLSNPEVVDTDNLTIDWNMELDKDGVVQFLVKEKGFSEQRVRGGLESLAKARKQKPQASLTDFFANYARQKTTTNSQDGKKPTTNSQDDKKPTTSSQDAKRNATTEVGGRRSRRKTA